MMATVTRKMLAELVPGDAAALWKVQQDCGRPYDAGLFDEWLRAQTANADAWDRLNHGWSLFEEADAVEFAALRRDALSVSPEVHDRSKGRGWQLALAASLLIAVVGGGALLLVREGALPGQDEKLISAREQPSKGTRYAADEGGETFELADGSEMILERGSAARAVFDGNARSVYLDRGTARFSVRHDPAHVFQVHAGRWSVMDFGTRFEVSLQEAASGKIGMRVALFEGAVRVDGDGNPAVMLQPGKELVARPGLPHTIADTTLDSGAAGGDDLAEFGNVTLADAVERFNRVNSVQLVITDPQARGLRVSGQFRLSNPSRFSETIESILPVESTAVGADKIVIRSRR